MGVCLRWITALLANHFVPNAVANTLDTCTIFVPAFFIALVVFAAQANIYSAEALVTFQLWFEFMFSILTIWGKRTTSPSPKNPVHFPLMGSFAWLALSTAICTYVFWFWFPGMKVLEQGTCPACAFLFTSADIYTSVQIFFKILAMLSPFFLGSIHLRGIARSACYRHRLRGGAPYLWLTGYG